MTFVTIFGIKLKPTRLVFRGKFEKQFQSTKPYARIGLKIFLVFPCENYKFLSFQYLVLSRKDESNSFNSLNYKTIFKGSLKIIAYLFDFVSNQPVTEKSPKFQTVSLCFLISLSKIDGFYFKFVTGIVNK